ncbi:MAG: pilus assembly protein [Hyphomicrobiaceae bacterium]
MMNFVSKVSFYPCFWHDRSGAIAIASTIILPILLMLVGGSIDYAIVMHKRDQLQSAADAAVLAGAKRLSFADHKRDDAVEITKAVIKNYMLQNAKDATVGGYTSATTVKTDPLVVSMKLRQSVETHFLSAFGYPTIDVNIVSAAQVVGQPNICLLTLDGSSSEALKVDKESRTQGNDCAIFSNSVSSSGVAVKNDAEMTANNVCSAGGFDLDGTVKPSPVYDCPQFEDPLASQQAPYVGDCTVKNLIVTDEDRTLQPGVYCGGIKIEGSSNITLAPGLYVIRDGMLEVKGESSFQGTGVSIYLDANASLKFHKETSIDLEASKSGEMPGLLIFASRGQDNDTKHKIESKKAQKMVGTLYFPTSTLEIGSFYSEGAAVGSGAAYTAVVAYNVKVKNKSSLVLNSDYALTDVPVPEGIRGVAQPVRLVE